MLDKLTDDILKKKNKDELREICASFGRTRCKSFTKKRLIDIILENQKEKVEQEEAEIVDISNQLSDLKIKSTNESISNEEFNKESEEESLYNYEEDLRMVREMRNKRSTDILKDKIRNAPTLLQKVIRTRNYLNAQAGASLLQEIILKDLGIGPPVDKMSGDGEKSGINYEIKVSVHAQDSKINFVQIRPHHNNDFYLLVAYDLYYGEVGRVYVFKVPADKLYLLLPQYGGYAHGTGGVNGIITKENIKNSCDQGTNYEYALRPQPNGSKKGKPYKLWLELLEYEVEYNKDNF